MQAVHGSRLQDGSAGDGADVTIGDRVRPPSLWHSRRDAQAIGLLLQSQQRFRNWSVEPSRRARAPSPAAANVIEGAPVVTNNIVAPRDGFSQRL